MNIIHTILIFYLFQANMLTLSSTLVETVSIDYEDFNESFLTCSTCLCKYIRSQSLSPKLGLEPIPPKKVNAIEFSPPPLNM